MSIIKIQFGSSVDPQEMQKESVPSRWDDFVEGLKKIYRKYFKRYSLVRRIIFLSRKIRNFIYELDVEGILGLNKHHNYPLLPMSEADVFVPVLKEEMVAVARPELIGTPSCHKSKSLRSSNYEFILPSVKMHQWSKAFVFGGSHLVFSEGRCYYNNLLCWESDYTSEELHRQIRFRKKINSVKKIISTQGVEKLPEAILLLDACSTNYSHWLTETLPKLGIICDIDELKHVPIILDKSLHKNILESALILAGKERPLFLVSSEYGLQVEKLFALSSVGYVPFYPRQKSLEIRNEGKFSPQALQSMRQKLVNKLIPAGSGLRLFIKRKSDYRRLKNAQDVETFFRQQGFKIINPIDYSFLEQVQLFHQAEVIVGETGAAMANIIFCRPETKIYIFMPDNNQTLFYYWQSMAQAVGNKVRYILCQSDDVDAHSDYVLQDEAWKTEFSVSFAE